MANPEKLNAVDSLIRQDSLSFGEKIEKISSLPADELIKNFAGDLIHFGLRILAALVIYIVGAWIIKRIVKVMKNIMTKRNVDKSLSTFLNSFVSISLTVILIVITVGALGVNTSSFAALLAASGVAIGMALSGTLQNFAGGVMILFFKPFKVGDFIDAQSFAGTVKAIQITTTSIVTPDNRQIIIPNGNLVNGVINNYSSMGIRRCDWKIGISYGDDVDVAKKVVLDILAADGRVLEEPEKPFVAVDSLADSAVVIVVKAWVKSSDYWGLYYSVNETVYKTFPQKGLSFPFPQMDVHVSHNS